MGKFNPGAKSEEVKSFFNEEDSAKGFEDIDSSTMAIPFLKIAQSLSPEMKSNKAEHIQGLELGDIFNNVTQEIYAKEGESIGIIIGQFEHMYIEWLPKRQGFVGYHTPEHAEKIATDLTFGKWKIKENLLQENYVYYILIEGHEHEGVLIMSLASTQIKKAKALNKRLTSYKMKNGKKALPYYLRWSLKTIEEHKDDNDWFGVSVNLIGVIEDEQQYISVKKERKLIENKRVDFAQLEAPVDSHSDSEDEDVDY